MQVNIAVSYLMKEIKKSQFLTDLLDKKQYNAFLKEVADSTLYWSQIYVPVASGHLKSTGRVRGSNTGYVIEYTASYASYVHEIMSIRHTAPQRADYLLEGFRYAMFSLLRKYGRDNIPDFNVRLYIDKGEGVSLYLTSYKESDNRSLSWRRFI